MKRRICALLALCLCAVLTWAAAEEEILIVHATDMHYLSPSLTDYGEAFMHIVENADGKVTHYTPQLMRAFVDDMLHLMPDAIILSGDLTLNGAELSHRELVQIMTPLQKAGIQLLALPGNHDSGTAAYRFGPEGAEPFASMADEQFDDMYAAFGYADALSRDAASMSYMAQLSPHVRCLLVDVNANGTYGTVQPETLAWADEQLRLAREAGAEVIAVTHQSVLQHNRLFSFGYTINNSASLLELLERHDVRLNLSGHLHMQHIAQSGELTEIAGSSLAVSPNQYGLVRMQNGRLLDYQTRPVDVAAWAQRSRQTNADLLQFASYSADFFDRTSRSQLTALFEGSTLDETVEQEMIEFAVRLNRDYFAGTRKASAQDAAAMEKWLSLLPDQFFTYYLQSILAEPAQAMNQYVFEE